MSVGVVVVEGAHYSGFLITARLAMEFGCEVYGVPGNAAQPSGFGPNQLIKQGARLGTNWEAVIEELRAPIRAELLPDETACSEERALLVEKDLAPAAGTLHLRLGVDESRLRDDLVELSRLASSAELAALFDREPKGVVRQLPGKEFLKVLL
jgi:DNA processing protein